jgi:hypothetical protein
MAYRLAKCCVKSRQNMLGIAICVLTAAKGLAINRKLTAYRFIPFLIFLLNDELAEGPGQGVWIKDP